MQIDGSFWADSFIHGSNGQDYYVAAHVMNYTSDIPGGLPPYRAAILDVTDPSRYLNFVKIGPADTPSYWRDSGEFHATFEGFGMETSSSDPLQGMHMYCALDGIEYDITFNYTSPVLLDVALGSYLVGGELGYEWAVPKGATEGWLKIDGETIDIVPEKSSTWYDRQWGSLQDSFQWIMIVLEESDRLDISVLCVWDWKDTVNGPKEFATVRSSRIGRDSVVPLKMMKSSSNIYTSPKTGLEYPTEWFVMLDGIEISVTTPRPDQVFEASG